MGRVVPRRACPALLLGSHRRDPRPRVRTEGDGRRAGAEAGEAPLAVAGHEGHDGHPRPGPRGRLAGLAAAAAAAPLTYGYDAITVGSCGCSADFGDTSRSRNVPAIGRPPTTRLALQPLSVPR